MTERTEIYSDIDVQFRRNALTGDVIKKKNLDDIRQSLGLLLQTRFYDRKWHPEIGSYLPTLLFNQDDDFIKNVLKEQITELIGKYEPRVELNNISIAHESIEDVWHGKVTIRIDYTVIVTGVTDTYIYTVNRLR